MQLLLLLLSQLHASPLVFAIVVHPPAEEWVLQGERPQPLVPRIEGTHCKIALLVLHVGAEVNLQERWL